MLNRVEALSYKCLRLVAHELSSFHILVGPNASGKSSFLDTIVFLQDLLRDGVDRAVRKRARSLRELTWQAQFESFEIAVEFSLQRDTPSDNPTDYRTVRYEVRVGVDPQGQGISLLVENLWLQTEMPNGERAFNTESESQLQFPAPRTPPRTIVAEPRKRSPSGWRKVMTRTPDGRVYFRSETTEWNLQLRPMPDQAGLTIIPDEERFPISFWLRKTLLEGVRFLMLNSRAMREPCAPDAPERFQPDGSNLPLVVHQLAQQQPQQFEAWVAHLRTVLPDIKRIRVDERQENRYRYLVMETQHGASVPSWLLSDGTLRLFALTLLAYIPSSDEVYVIEEPENGIHPRAIEAVYQSLSSIYNGQVLCATHSPIFLNLATPKDLLCFALDEEGATDIVRGDRHPRLKQWRKETSLGSLLASGILG